MVAFRSYLQLSTCNCLCYLVALNKQQKMQCVVEETAKNCKHLIAIDHNACGAVQTIAPPFLSGERSKNKNGEHSKGTNTKNDKYFIFSIPVIFVQKFLYLSFKTRNFQKLRLCW